MKKPTSKPITDYVAEHGEGPIYDPISKKIYWVDLLQGKVLSRISDTEKIIDLNEPVGCIGLTKTGGLILGMQNGFGLLEDGKIVSYYKTSQYYPTTNIRFNDGIVGPDGAFYAGTMEMNGEKQVGQLFRLTPEGNSKVLDEGLKIPNGMVDKLFFF